MRFSCIRVCETKHGETYGDIWQRIKRNDQGLRIAGQTVDIFDMADALKGSLNPKHVHWIITIDTSSVTLDELEEKILTMDEHVDKVLYKNPAD